MSSPKLASARRRRDWSPAGAPRRRGLKSAARSDEVQAPPDALVMADTSPAVACDGTAHVLTRSRSQGPYPFDSISPSGAVLRGKVPGKVGRVVSMAVHLRDASFRIDAEIVAVDTSGAEARWSVLFRNVLGATERILWELSSGQRTPAALPRVAVLDQSLLEAARREAPFALRVVLSGQDSRRATALAHHVLAKPCSAEALGKVLEEAAARLFESA
jgi:hypothetical protein